MKRAAPSIATRGTGSGQQPQVAVYTITYNQRDRVCATIEGLLSQDYPSDRYEVVVLDDGSTDDTRPSLRALARRSVVPVTILSCSHEADYLSAKRWNQCIRASSALTKVFIQVDDVNVRKDFIRQHVKWHRSDEQIVVTGAKFEGPTERWDLGTCRRARLAGPEGAASPTDCFSAVWGASLSFTRRLMQAAAQPPHELPYDERMTGWGFHEVEFAYRLQQAGGRIIYDPSAGVFHQDHTPETEWRRGLDRAEILEKGMERNRQYILSKHGLAQLPRW